MKTRLRKLIAATLLLSTVIHQLTTPTALAQGTAFTYQGRLDASTNAANGYYDLRFALFDASSSGTQLGGAVTNAAASVTDGYFTVLLDFGANFPGADRWLEIAVRTNGGGTFATLIPRQQLTPSPYAITAGNLSGTIPLAQLPASVVTNGAGGLNLSGNLSGSFTGNGAGLTNVPGVLLPQTPAGTSVAAQTNIAYNATNAALTTFTLPATANVGDVIQVNGLGAGGWQVNGNIPSGIPGVVWTPQAGAPSTNWSAVASSADGSKLVAAISGGQIYTSTDSGVTWTPRPSAPATNWSAVVSSADGGMLVAAVNGGQIYTSTDSGVTWTAQNSGSRIWTSVASSADGSKLVAAASALGQIYTSTDSGVTWTARISPASWTSVASSSDGTKLVAVGAFGPFIFISTDSGTNWTPQAFSANWSSVASSTDGSKLVAANYGGQIYTSTNSGVTWPAQNSGIRLWTSVASSADGSKLVAVVYGGQIYTSTATVSGAPGSSQQFQYAGNGVWQAVKVADAGLSANVALRAGGNNFTGNQTVLSGNVGIGTTGPLTPLEVRTPTFLARTALISGPGGSIWSFYDTAAPGNGNSNPFVWDMFGTTNAFQIAISGVGYPLTILRPSGNVGIGTTTPTEGKLVVRGAGSYTSPGFRYFNGGTAGLGFAGGPILNTPISIYAENKVVASEFNCDSDARIKSIIGRSDGEKDLKALLGIQVTDYTYKDVIRLGSRPTKKVIGQQLEEVYPQAVTKSTDVVPDIYQKATQKDGWVQLATDLKVGERVRLIGEKEEGIHEVLEVRKDAFRTAFKPATEKVFVYGREVKDFRTVDYEAIAMLNVSATQELARKVKAQETQLTAQEAELTELRAEKAALAEKLAGIEKAVAQLTAESRSAKVAGPSAPSAHPTAAVRKTLTTASAKD